MIAVYLVNKRGDRFLRGKFLNKEEAAQYILNQEPKFRNLFIIEPV